MQSENLVNIPILEEDRVVLVLKNIQWDNMWILYMKKNQCNLNGI